MTGRGWPRRRGIGDGGGNPITIDDGAGSEFTGMGTTEYLRLSYFAAVGVAGATIAPIRNLSPSHSVRQIPFVAAAAHGMGCASRNGSTCCKRCIETQLP